MQTTYFLFKFLHVAGASLWIGGLVTLAVLNVRVARTTDAAGLAVSARQSQQIGKLLLLPSAAVTLIAGGVAMGVSGLKLDLWIAWGLVAVVLAIALGAVLGRRLGASLGRLATKHGADAQTLVLRRVAGLNAAVAAILLSATWAMVFKPTF